MASETVMGSTLASLNEFSGVFSLEENIRVSHNMIIEDRKKFTLSGIKDVVSFDEQTVMLESVLGQLAIKGDGLHINSFDNETGDLSGVGKIHDLVYTAKNDNGGFFSRIFK